MNLQDIALQNTNKHMRYTNDYNTTKFEIPPGMFFSYGITPFSIRIYEYLLTHFPIAMRERYPDFLHLYDATDNYPFKRVSKNRKTRSLKHIAHDNDCSTFLATIRGKVR